MAGVEPNSGKNPGNTIQCLSNSEGQAPNCSYCHKERHFLAQCVEFLKVSPSDQPTSVRKITHKTLSSSECGIKRQIDVSTNCINFQCIERNIWILKPTFIEKHGFDPDTGVVHEDKKVPLSWKDKVLFPDRQEDALVDNAVTTFVEDCSGGMAAVNTHGMSPGSDVCVRKKESFGTSERSTLGGRAIMVSREIDIPVSKVQHTNEENALEECEVSECSSIISDTARDKSIGTEMADKAHEAADLLFFNNFQDAKAKLDGLLRGMSEEHFDCINKIFDNYLVERKVIVEVTDHVKNPLKEHAIWWGRFLGLDHNPIATSPYVEATERNVKKTLLKANLPPEYRKLARFIWISKDRSMYRYFQFKTPVEGDPDQDIQDLVLCHGRTGLEIPQFSSTPEETEEEVIVPPVKSFNEDEAANSVQNLVQVLDHVGLEVLECEPEPPKLAKGTPEPFEEDNKVLPFFNFNEGNALFSEQIYAPRVLTLSQYISMDMKFLSSTPAYTYDASVIWTKAECLSLIERIFDPLGYAAPVLLQGSLLMRDLWEGESDCSDPLTGYRLRRWTKWLSNLPILGDLNFKQVIFSDLLSESFQGFLSKGLSVQLHVFVDVSNVAIASSAYIKITYRDESSIYTNFIQAEYSVIPDNVSWTFSRLGLMSLHQGSKLAVNICASLDVSKDDVTIWSSSEAAVQCLEAKRGALSPLADQYYEKIEPLIPVKQIRWIPTVTSSCGENPAEIAALPRSVPELIELEQWTLGPSFLREPSTN